MLKDFIMNIHFSVRRCRCGLLHLLYQKHHLLSFLILDASVIVIQSIVGHLTSRIRLLFGPTKR